MRKNSTQLPAVVAKGIIDAAMFCANLCTAAMMALVCLNVFLRYLFRAPLYWGDEIMIYLMILSVFLGFSHMLIENRHVRMTAIVERLSVRTQNILWVITGLLGIGYFVFLLAAALYITRDAFQTEFISTITGWPIGPWQAVVCAGLAILLMAGTWFTVKKGRLLRGVHEAGREVEKRELHDMIE